MSILRFVADVHIGNHKQFGGEVKVGVNDRARRILKALNFVKERSDRLVVLGDLFDTSHPSPQMLAATMEALGPSIDQFGTRRINAHLLLGNHDMVSAEPGDNALAPLRPLHHVWDTPSVAWDANNVALFMVPFRPEPMIDWFAEEVGNLLAIQEEDRAAADKILCFHGGVRDSVTPHYLRSSPDAIDVDLLFDVMERADIKQALCGNWHNHRVWKRNGRQVMQVGALVPTGFDNEGWDYGFCAEYRTHNRSLILSKIPSARFLALTTKEAKALRNNIRAHAGGVYLKVKLAQGETQEEAQEALRPLEDPDGTSPLLGVVYAPHEEDTAQQEQEAAEAARTADTLEGALREYVQTMPLPENVERQAVEAKVLNYMARE